MKDPDAQRRECLQRWDTASPGWAKAESWLREFSRPVSHWLIDALNLQSGHHVLELAAGPGETGFLAAELIAPGGTLICSDQSDAMLNIARLRAAELGLENVDFRVINAESIALPVASIDAVLCRWGYMLMIDPLAALIETRRVLRPGGRVALAVWDRPEDNAWLAVPWQVLAEHGRSDPLDPNGVGTFALADRGRLGGLLEEAGFTEIEIDAIELERDVPDFETWWQQHLDMSPAGPLVRAADPGVRQQIEGEVKQRLGSNFDARSLVAVAHA